MSAATADRSAKFRQAAFVYLHVGLLYEAAVWSMRGTELLPTDRGPIWAWLLVGALIVAVVFWGLWWWQNAWFARAVWAVACLRLPSLVHGAFLQEIAGPVGPTAAAGESLPPAFYLTALVVVVVNLGFLARAGWDL